MTTNYNSNLNFQKIHEEFSKIVEQAEINLDGDISDELRDLMEIDIHNFSKEINDLYQTRDVKIKLLRSDAVFPKFAYDSDSGFDLHSVEQITIPPFGRALVPTGISVSFSEGLELQIRPKSGLAINMGLTVLNTPGTIDQGYNGEIMVIVFNTNNNAVVIERGMKVAQGVFCPVFQGKFINFQNVSSLEETERGNNGFGSTGI